MLTFIASIIITTCGFYCTSQFYFSSLSLSLSLSTDVLGHPFGKVPPSRAFDGCTPTEAEVILTDPANPVGKTLLAGEPLSSPPLLSVSFFFFFYSQSLWSSRTIYHSCLHNIAGILYLGCLC